MPDGAYELFDGYTYQYLLTCPGYAGRSGTIEPSHSASGTLVLKIDEDAVVVTGGRGPRRNDPQRCAEERNAGGSFPPNGPISAERAMTPMARRRHRRQQQRRRIYPDAGGCRRVHALLVECDRQRHRQRLDRLPAAGGRRSDRLRGGYDLPRRPGFRRDPDEGQRIARRAFPSRLRPMQWHGVSSDFPTGTTSVNAETLQSLWIYHDPLEGQPNSPITVCGDYLYTGFWRSEESPANFVCLSITDEDPARTDEEKTACWYWTTPGGYYWGRRVCLRGLCSGRHGRRRGRKQVHDREPSDARREDRTTARQMGRPLR